MATLLRLTRVIFTQEKITIVIELFFNSARDFSCDSKLNLMENTDNIISAGDCS